MATKEYLKQIVKSCIMATKGGLPTKHLQDAYRKVTGTSDCIPIYQAGYISLFHLLNDIPEVQCSNNETGDTVLVMRQSKNKRRFNETIEDFNGNYLRQAKSARLDYDFCQ